MMADQIIIGSHGFKALERQLSDLGEFGEGGHAYKMAYGREIRFRDLRFVAKPLAVVDIKTPVRRRHQSGKVSA